MSRCSLLCGLLSLLTAFITATNASRIWGQTPGTNLTCTVLKPTADDKIVRGVVEDQRPQKEPPPTFARVKVLNAEGSLLATARSDVADASFAVPTSRELIEGETVEVELLSQDLGPIGQTCSETVGPGQSLTCEDKYDCRDNIEVSAYVGIAVDTFAAAEERMYLNPETADTIEERAIGGFDFAYRLYDSHSTRRKTETPGHQLWIYGETVHGVRSADVDCGATPNFITCRETFTTPDDIPDPNQVFAIIRNASSLEAFTGLRYEFATLNKESQYPARVYAKAQAGFLKVVGRPDDVVNLHHIGLGAILTKGSFSGSYIEAGVARNDLFQSKRNGRLLVDALVSREIGAGVSFFAQMILDSDLGPGADSVQSYFGFDFDLNEMFTQ